DTASTDEDTPVEISASNLTSNDSAGPANENVQVLTVTSVSATADTHGTVSLSSGTITYSPDQNYNGPASFTYQVCDNGTTNGAPDSQCATGTVNVTVNSVNDAPTLNAIANQNTVVGSNVSLLQLAPIPIFRRKRSATVSRGLCRVERRSIRL